MWSPLPNFCNLHPHSNHWGRYNNHCPSSWQDETKSCNENRRTSLETAHGGKRYCYLQEVPDKALDSMNVQHQISFRKHARPNDLKNLNAKKISNGDTSFSSAERQHDHIRYYSSVVAHPHTNTGTMAKGLHAISPYQPTWWCIEASQRNAMAVNRLVFRLHRKVIEQQYSIFRVGWWS